MIVLALESSCDDTAAAVLGPSGILADVVWSQDLHARWGGVVPEVASRAHAEQIVPVTRAALAQAGLERPDAVVATSGPGLVGAVLVGLSFAKGLAAGWGVPFLGVNHLEGHLLAPLLETPAPSFPFLGLVVSGGHTTLYLARGLGDYVTLAETVDDAVGEAFDKVARMLGLGYPGGPKVDALAMTGDPRAVKLPRPRPPEGAGPLDMSFSGLKTAVRTSIERTSPTPADVAASFQQAVCDVLLDRVKRAAAETGVQRVALGGGAAANSAIRAAFLASGLEVFLPPRARCTDNAAMIANVGRLRLAAGLASEAGLATTARPRWPVGAP